jgi:hypothetical protein
LFALVLSLPLTARAADRCSMQNTHRYCQSDREASQCAYCIAPAVTHVIDHDHDYGCRGSCYPVPRRRENIFDCAWMTVGTKRGNDWYAQAWNIVRRSTNYEEQVKAALWADHDVQQWLQAKINSYRTITVPNCDPGPTSLPTSCRPADVPALADLAADWMDHRCRMPTLRHRGDRAVLFDCAWQGIQGPERINEFISRGYVTPELRELCRMPVAMHEEVTLKQYEVLLADAHAFQTSDGISVATNQQVVQLPDGGPSDETCTAPTFTDPDADYFLAPAAMLDLTPTEPDLPYELMDGRFPIPEAIRALFPHLSEYGIFAGFQPPYRPHPRLEEYRLEPGFIGANEGRLVALLGDAAKLKDPIHALCQSAQRFASNDEAFGNAFADLSVTGKAAFASFVQLGPTEASLRANPECQGTRDADLARALDRAYKVATVIRAGTSISERRTLGWIAVSGEDDPPHRPVNVPSVTLNNMPPVNGRPFSFPQFDIQVSVPGKPTVNTRYTIMHATPPSFVRPAPLVDRGPQRRIPADYTPQIAPTAEVILFIHGMDSRVEEAMHLTAALHKLAPETHKNWTIVSVDLPSSGYANSIDHQDISPTSAVNFNHNRAVPLVDYLEEFIVAFVNTLSGQVPNLKSRMAVIVGGSLGGNMALRLGRRHVLRPGEDLSWIRAVIPWSPAAIWPSYANDVWGGLGHVNRLYAAVRGPLQWSGGDAEGGAQFFDEKRVRRMELFYGAFDWRPMGFIGSVADPTAHKAQADLWWRDGWLCKPAAKIGARLDRHETYDGNFRRWHWRLGAEQLLFSHWETIPCCQDPRHVRTPPLFARNTKPMFLSCGKMDVGGNLCAMTVDASRKMVNTPGYFRLLENTGHSIDNERPMWLARQVVEFLHAFSAAATITGYGGKCLDIRGGESRDGAEAQIYTCHGRPNQRWRLTDAGEIRGDGDKCLDVRAGDTRDGALVQIYPCHNGSNQKWTLTERGEITGLGGKCLDIRGGTAADESPVQLWPCHGGDNQKWTVVMGSPE